MGRPLLAVSDIHGHLDALEAVLDQMVDTELCGIVAAGDHCLGGPQPFEVWQRLLQLGATMVRGESDLALASVDGATLAARGEFSAERVAAFQRTQDALGDIVCRRLGELPTTAVVSMDDRSGVMVVHGSPAYVQSSIVPEHSDDELEQLMGCVAEDALVVGRSHRGFVRRRGPVLVVNAGSVGEGPTGPDGARRAHAVLLQEFSDGVLRAAERDVLVPARARGRRALRSRKVG